MFRDVPELVEAIESYVEKHNENPKPFIWTVKASDILAKVKHARKALHNVLSVPREPLALAGDRLCDARFYTSQAPTPRGASRASRYPSGDACRTACIG